MLAPENDEQLPDEITWVSSVCPLTVVGQPESLYWKNRRVVITRARSVYFSILFGYFAFQLASTKGFTERVCHLGWQSNNSEWNATVLVWLYGDYKPIIWHHKSKHAEHTNWIHIHKKKIYLCKKKKDLAQRDILSAHFFCCCCYFCFVLADIRFCTDAVYVYIQNRIKATLRT